MEQAPSYYSEEQKECGRCDGSGKIKEMILMRLEDCPECKEELPVSKEVRRIPDDQF
jgi:hypothetical protein